MKKAFTLIELLIVIGIIAVLSAVLLGTFGGATESARAAKCMSNMRTLAGLSAAAAIKDASNRYLAAGSYQILEVSTESAEIYYQKYDGWISWLCRGNEFKDGKKFGGPASGIKTLPFFGNGNREDEIFALTNGTLALASRSCNRDLYICPSHAHYRGQKHLSKPIYSYAMNAIFGFDTSKGSGVSGWGVQSFGNISNPQYVYEEDEEKKKRISPKLAPERTLMFAEIPFLKWSDGSWSPAADVEGVESDMVLNFKATVGGCERGKFWDGNPEAIGFNHTLSGKKRCAHVVFADGHVEKFVHAPNGELDDYQLTAQLCEGGEVSYKGSGYYAIESGR